jgi:hypothetical protein
MKKKRLKAMAALLKFLVLLASFHSGSYAHAFTSLSPVAGNQVRVNHLIRFQQPMSNPKNEPSREPIREPTKRMELDAELPTNFSSKKSREVDSKPKQDAKLPGNIASTQLVGSCHGKKSEPESLAEQPIAATDSSQRGLCHGKKSELESLAEQPIAATDSSQYNLPAGLGVLGLRSAKTINLPAGLVLRSANSSNLSAVKTKSNDALPFGGKSIKSFDYALSFRHTASSTLQLIVASVTNEFSKGPTIDSPAKQRPVPKDNPAIESVGFIQKFQSRLQKDLVNLSLSNAFSTAKLDSISIKAKSNSAMLIDLPTSQQKAMILFYDGSSQFIVKYIYSVDSAGAHTANSCNETTF